jgi:hypothetical protein
VEPSQLDALDIARVASPIPKVLAHDSASLKIFELLAILAEDLV